jgi:hypothetical protein
VCRCFASVLISVGLFLLHVSFPAKLVVLGGPLLAHILAPFWSIGWVEGAMWGGATGVAVIIGYVLEHSQRTAFLQRRYMRHMDEEAVHLISHCLKDRFIALKGIAESVRGRAAAHAPHLLREPHTMREELHDLLSQIHGGIRVCLSESIIRMITHDQYVRTDVEFDLVGWGKQGSHAPRLVMRPKKQAHSDRFFLLWKVIITRLHSSLATNYDIPQL